MQLSSVAAASASSPPARERIRPLMPEDIRGVLPDALLNARIGRGTVASEYDRAIRVRLEGDGAPSTRTIVPETTTAQRLLASKAGPEFEALVRHSAGVADAAKGADDLRTYTLVPDEHSAKAVMVLDQVSDQIRAFGVPDAAVQLSPRGTPAAERKAASAITKQLSAGIPSDLRFSAAWNAGGNILVTPDVSRNLLATIGAYRPGPGDSLVERPPAVREAILRDDWDTLVHETHHSATPMPMRGSEVTSVFEEAIASIFGRRDRTVVARKVGARIGEVAQDPHAAVDQAKLGWKPWNRGHLPEPPAELVETAQGRYVDGPAVVRDLLGVAGVDLRTKDGHRQAFEILQGREAKHAPRRLADAIITKLGVPPEHREAVVEHVRESVSSERGAGHVTGLLHKLGVLDRA